VPLRLRGMGRDRESRKPCHSTRWSAVRRSRHGIDESNVAVLERTLIGIAQSEDIQTSEASEYGTKHVVRGALTALNGRTVVIASVWIIESGQQHMRTALEALAPLLRGAM
jgi:hypothetical protein